MWSISYMLFDRKQALLELRQFWSLPSSSAARPASPCSAPSPPAARISGWRCLVWSLSAHLKRNRHVGERAFAISLVSALNYRTFSDLITFSVRLSFDDVTLYQALHDLLWSAMRKSVIFQLCLMLEWDISRSVCVYLISACGVWGTVRTRIISKLEDKSHRRLWFNMIKGCDAAAKPLGGAQPPNPDHFSTWFSWVPVFSSLCLCANCRIWALIQVASPSTDLGLGIRLKGTGRVLPSSK